MAKDRYTPDGSMESLMRSLQQIGIDLWGNPATSKEAMEAKKNVERDFEALSKDPYLKAAQAPQAAPTAPAAPEPAAEVKQEVPQMSFSDFWRQSDDAIDWTEVMTHTKPADGVKDTERWAFCHSMARRVLDGDIDAYGEVINRERPLDDVAEYAASLDVTVNDADAAAVCMQVRPDMLALNGLDYPAALSLRAARDMMALLPLNRVQVIAMQDEKQLMDVTWRREKLNRVRMNYVDPLALAKENGAMFAAAETDAADAGDESADTAE